MKLLLALLLLFAQPGFSKDVTCLVEIYISGQNDNGVPEKVLFFTNKMPLDDDSNLICKDLEKYMNVEVKEEK